MNNSAISVRPMTLADNEPVADLIEGWRSHEAFKLRQHYERYVSEAVAECDGALVGWVSYNIHECNPDVIAEYEDSTEIWMYVVEIYTSPEARRLGVGRALMRYAEEQGRRARVRYSILMPEADDNTPSGIRQDLMEFYRELGYVLMQPSSDHAGYRKPWLMGLALQGI